MASDDNSFFGLKVPDGNDRRELYKSQYRAIYTFKMSAQELDQSQKECRNVASELFRVRNGFEEANNQLTEVLPEHIASTPKLQILGLNGNLISNISPATFANTPMMDDLRLDVNSISSLPAELLTPIANLTQLEIDNNNITSLPTGFLASVPMLVKLQLAKNPYPVRRACAVEG